MHFGTDIETDRLSVRKSNHNRKNFLALSFAGDTGSPVMSGSLRGAYTVDTLLTGHSKQCHLACKRKAESAGAWSDEHRLNREVWEMRKGDLDEY
jgi:hypothetical protein